MNVSDDDSFPYIKSKVQIQLNKSKLIDRAPLRLEQLLQPGLRGTVKHTLIAGNDLALDQVG
jgi:hypothetical protein